MTKQDLKVCDFQQIGELTQIVACRAVKSEALGSLPTGGNILLLDFFLFSRVPVEYTERISI